MVAAIAAIAAFVRYERARLAIVMLAGTYAAFVGLSDASVLVRGFAVSALSETSIRVAVAVAVGAGLVAAIPAGLVIARSESGSRPRAPCATRRPMMTVPRKRLR